MLSIRGYSHLGERSGLRLEGGLALCGVSRWIHEKRAESPGGVDNTIQALSNISNEWCVLFRFSSFEIFKAETANFSAILITKETLKRFLHLAPLAFGRRKFVAERGY